MPVHYIPNPESIIRQFGPPGRELPAEILSKITKSLKNSDLGNCRLVSKELELHAARNLFQKFMIKSQSAEAATASVERLRDWSEHSRLGKILEHADICYYTLWNTPTARVNAQVSGQQEELRRYDRDRDSRVQLLHSALERCPNIKELSLADGYASDEYEFSIYPRTSVMTPVKEREPAVGMQNLRPTVVRIEQVRADSFDFDKTYYQCLSRVRQCKLIYSMHLALWYCGETPSFENLAKNLPCVEELHFGFKEELQLSYAENEFRNTSEGGARPLRRGILRFMLKQKFSKLKTLVFENIMTTEEGLLNFLQNADTLRNLRFNGLGMYGDLSKYCLVELSPTWMLPVSVHEQD